MTTIRGVNTQKTYQRVVVGGHFLSALVALLEARSSEEVLYIVDDRISFGHHWAHHLGPLSLSFLKFMGRTYSFSPLENLDEYLTPSPFHLKLDKKWIYLGRSPYENFQELLRKIPHYFNTETHLSLEAISASDFNRDFFAMTQKLTQELQNAQDLKVLDLKNLERMFTEWPNNPTFNALKTFSLFHRQGKGEKELFDVFKRHFVFCLQGIFENYFADFYHHFEIHFLFLELISPRYEVKTELLLHDLMHLPVLEHKVRKTRIESWQYDTKGRKGSISALLLSSYEGVVHPKELMLVGNFTSDIPFLLDESFEGLKSFGLEAEAVENYFSDFVGEVFYFGRKADFGPDFPMFFMQVLAPGKILVKFLYQDGPGTRPEFYLDYFWCRLMEELTELFPVFRPAKIKVTKYFAQDWEFWPTSFLSQDIKRSSGAPRLFRHRLKPKFMPEDIQTFSVEDKGLLEELFPHAKKNLTNVEVLAQVKLDYLGLLSFLLELHHHYKAKLSLTK